MSLVLRNNLERLENYIQDLKFEVSMREKCESMQDEMDKFLMRFKSRCCDCHVRDNEMMAHLNAMCILALNMVNARTGNEMVTIDKVDDVATCYRVLDIIYRQLEEVCLPGHGDQNDHVHDLRILVGRLVEIGERVKSNATTVFSQAQKRDLFESHVDAIGLMLSFISTWRETVYRV